MEENNNSSIQYIGVVNHEYLFCYLHQANIIFFTDKQSDLFKYDSSKPMTILAKAFILNRVYLVLQSINQVTDIHVVIIDLTIKQGFEVLLDDSNMKEIAMYINKNCSCVVEENLLMLIGGINQKNKASPTIVSFDISLYTFAKQKYQEFTMFPRYRHGSTSYNGIVYIIGGFTQVPENDNNISEVVQFIKYSNNALHKFSIAKVDGETPLLMIDPSIEIVNEKYVAAFSTYHYPKVWIMDTVTNQGKNYAYKETPMTHQLQWEFSSEENDNKKVMFYTSINSTSLSSQPQNTFIINSLLLE